jgi:hypothetical protein
VYARSNPVTFVDLNGLEVVVFIVGSSNRLGDSSGAFGHAAIWVSSDGHSNGWSLGGTFAFKENQGYAKFVQSYQSLGRSVLVFVLKTTPEQDAKMLSYINNNAPRFNICTNNCTTTTGDVLKQGAVLPRTDLQPFGGTMISTDVNLTTPESLEDALENEYSSVVAREYVAQPQREWFHGPDPESGQGAIIDGVWVFFTTFGSRC